MLGGVSGGFGDRALLVGAGDAVGRRHGAAILERRRLGAGEQAALRRHPHEGVEQRLHLGAVAFLVPGLADPEAAGIVLFDIGGGSSEIVWLAREGAGQRCHDRRADGPLRARIRAWRSMPVGVVRLAEMFGGHTVTPATFDAMVDHVAGELVPFVAAVAGEARCPRFHLLGTSGTVTTIAGVHLGLARYDRRRVDGLWMSPDAVAATMA